MKEFTFEDKGARYKYKYARIVKDLNRARDQGDTEAAIGIIRRYCKKDLFFLLYFILNIRQCNHPWVVERIKEVEDQNDMTLDLWAREHWKTTICTIALNIQEILKDPEVTICIFSETRNIAKAFLRRIKFILEQNELLKQSFPDVLWSNPASQSQSLAFTWSEDSGLIVKRKGTFTEATVEAWGTDSLPTGKHFAILDFDDMVNEKTVNTPEQMDKLKNSFQLAQNLTRLGGKVRIKGTIYHFADLHQHLEETGEWFVRKYPAEDEDGHGVYMDGETLRRKRKIMGKYVYASQMLLRPFAKEDQVFDVQWIKYYSQRAPSTNRAIFVDPARTSKPQADYSVFGVIDLDPLNNYFLTDLVRDRLDLQDRWRTLRELVRTWNCKDVYYEKTGSGIVDIQYIEEKMDQEGIFFNLVPIDHQKVPKEERIKKILVPLFQEGLFRMPHAIIYYDKDEKRHDLIHEFITEEFTRFPFSTHDDMMDLLSMVKSADVDFYPPITIEPEIHTKAWNPLESDRYDDGVTWMAG